MKVCVICYLIFYPEFKHFEIGKCESPYHDRVLKQIADCMLSATPEALGSDERGRR